MMNLFITFDKNFFLSSAGPNVVLKYDLLNDIYYEIGAQLSFMAGANGIDDKAMLIYDFLESRTDQMDRFHQIITASVMTVLLEKRFGEEIKLTLPDVYAEWLCYHTNVEYNKVGKALIESSNVVILDSHDLFDYINRFINKTVKSTITENPQISRYTIVENIDPEVELIKLITSFRAGLKYERFIDDWTQCAIGEAYKDGIGVDKDIIKAMPFYMSAAEQGNKIAINQIGWYFQSGVSVEKDETKALYYYEKASDLGNTLASANAGYCYHNGIGTTINYLKAVEYYTIGSKDGITFAQNNLANIYYDGLLGSPDYEKAFEIYSELANQLDQYNAQCRAGLLMLEGKGCKQNKKEGIRLLKNSIDGGNGEGLHAYTNYICETGDIGLIKQLFNQINEYAELHYLDKTHKPEFYYEVVYLKNRYGRKLPGNIKTSQMLRIAIKNNYAPAISLKQEIEDAKKLKEHELELKMDELMRKINYTEDEIKFLKKHKEWENKFLEKDKFGVTYDRKYHRLVTIEGSKIWRDYYREKHDYQRPQIDYEIEEGTEIICENCFSGSDYIKSITIPNSVRMIGKSAFSNLSVEKITIPKSVVEIAYDCFSNTHLQSIEFKSSNIKLVDYHKLHIWCNIKEIIVPKGTKNYFFELLYSQSRDLIKEAKQEVSEDNNPIKKKTKEPNSKESKIQSNIIAKNELKSESKEPSKDKITPKKKSKDTNSKESKSKTNKTAKKESKSESKETQNQSNVTLSKRGQKIKGRTVVSNASRINTTNNTNKRTKTQKSTTNELKISKSVESNDTIFSKIKKLFGKK